MADTGKAYWITSGIQTIFEKFSMLLFNFGAFFLIVRVYTKEEFGFWTLFLASIMFLEMAKNGLVQNGLVKFLATAEQEEKGKISTASLFLNFSLACIFILAILIFANKLSVIWSAPILKELFTIYIFTTLILVPYSHFNFVQNGNLKFKGPMWANFTRAAVFFFSVLGVYINWLYTGYKPSLIFLAIVQIVGIAAAALVSYLFAKEYLFFERRIDKLWVNKLFNYGKYVFGTNLSTMLYKNIDTWMLGYYLNPASVALYRVCISINNFLEAPSQSIAQIVFPQGAKAIETGGANEIRELYEKAVGGILALVVPGALVLLLFPAFILDIVAGDKYIEAQQILRLTVFYALFFPFASQFGTILDSIGRPKINFIFIVISTTINIILNIIMIQKFGVIGAAYATLITYSITFIMDQIVLYRLFKVKFWNAIRRIPNFYLIAFGILKESISNRKLSIHGPKDGEESIIIQENKES